MIIIDIIISVTKIVFHFDLFNKNSRKSSPHSFLVLFLQHGYQITRKDRETIRDKCEYVVYKKLATLSRLSFTLYEQGRPDLIAELFNSVDSFIKSIYTIESLLSNILNIKPMYGFVLLITQLLIIEIIGYFVRLH